MRLVHQCTQRDGGSYAQRSGSSSSRERRLQLSTMQSTPTRSPPRKPDHTRKIKGGKPARTAAMVGGNVTATECAVLDDEGERDMSDAPPSIDRSAAPLRSDELEMMSLKRYMKFTFAV
jgi:hypothetical protein